MWGRKARACAMAAMAFAANPALAEDYAAHGFALRFPAALARFSSYGDVAGYGGASVGSRYPSSVNPAATDWIAPQGGGYVLSPQYSRLRFANAPDLRISTLSAGASLPGLGGFQPSYTRIANDGPQRGDFLLLDGHAAQLQWGGKLGGELALGVNVNTSRFRSRAGLGGMLLADGATETDGLKLGLLWVPSARLSAGLMADYARARADTAALDPGCLCSVRFSDRSHSRGVRAGLNYAYDGQSSVYADVLRARYTGIDGAMTSRILFAGLEQQLRPWLFLRGGLAHDRGGHTGQTLGLGLTPAPYLVIDLAYQRDMFPELRPEFGRSSLFNFSVGILW